jgi:transposase
MTHLTDLSRMTHAEKDALILALWAQVQELLAVNADLVKRIIELEARLGEPQKTPDNSSTPPSQGRKANKQPGSGKRKTRRKGHGGGGRPLHSDPDQRVVAKVKSCPHCHSMLGDSDHRLHAVYDKIELPRPAPIVTRVELYAATCPHCAEHFVAPVPAGLEPGSPFTTSVAATAVYLRYEHAISYKRLSKLFDDLCGLKISQAALANLFQRVKPSFDAQFSAILARLRQSRIVCSDETGARVKGRNAWEWVFQNDDVCVHVIRNSRAKAVAEEVMDGHKPAIWVSDLYGGQRGLGEAWQICMAHQLRDCQYAIDAGDAIFAPGMKTLILRACVLARRRGHLKDRTLQQYRGVLERRMDRVMACQPVNKHGVRLRKRYGKDRNSLFTFMTDRDVPPTNNGSERAIRPSTTFRKVTGGFRADWGADFYAKVRSVLNTGRRQGLSAFQAIQSAIAGECLI